MKTNKQTTVATTVASPDTLENIVARRMAAEKDGSITLEELEKALPHLPHAEIVKQARNLNLNGAGYKVGRHGAKSRIDFGAKLTEKPIYTPRQPKSVSTPSAGQFGIKFKLGNQEINLPISFELEAMAA